MPNTTNDIEVAQVVRAHRFELAGKDGTTLATLGVADWNDSGGAVLRLCGADGTEFVEIVVDEAGGAVELTRTGDEDTATVILSGTTGLYEAPP